MKLKVKYKPNPHQKEFHEDLVSKYLIISSGYSGGKTYALCQKMIQLSWLNRPFPGGLMSPDFKEMKRDVIPEFEKIAEQSNFEFKFNRQEMFLKFPWTPGKLYLFSAENKLRGPNLAYFGLNEVTLIEQVRYREAIGRVRIKGTRCPQVVGVGTPEGIGNYIYEMFIERPMKNSRIIYGDTRDNLVNIDPDYIDLLKNSYDEISLKAYLEGQWINMNGNQFYYAFDPKKNCDKTIKRDPIATIHCFMDFNVEHMTATLWHFDGQRLSGFDEIVIPNNADTKKMTDALKARGYTPDRTIVYPDPAGNARSTKGMPDNEILRQNGFHQIRVRSVQPRMRQRQLNVNNLLDKCQIVFNSDAMPTLSRDLQAVEQDPVTLEKSKKNPKLTHASDGLDYGCDILFEFSGKKPRSEVVRYR